MGIELKNISKDFSGKFVLSDINLFFKENLIHAVVGENGAGKSTLMNILSGVYLPSTGSIHIDGRDAEIQSPKDAEVLGIGMVHQHFMLIDILKVWQNIILGIEPGSKLYINKKEAINRINATCEKYNIKIDLNKPVGLLTVGEQQRVEILKVLARDAKYIIFDEPTSVLTPAEIDSLLESLRKLKVMGKTIIFISHKLEEVIHIANTITVLRDGKSQGQQNANGARIGDIAYKMVGRDIDPGRYEKNAVFGETTLKINCLSTRQNRFNCALNNLSLDVRKGEIFGVAGIDGNGQLELVNALLGLEAVISGEIFLNGENITGKKTPELRRERIACIPPDRHEQGLVLPESIFRNAVLGCEHQREFKKGPFLSIVKVCGAVAALVNKYGVKYVSLEQPIRDLSGGNQQKIILARECEWKGTELILAVNPTRGLDIGAIEFVYKKLNDYKKEGKAILLISTELSEILSLSDRIAVLFRGGITYVTENEKADIKKIGLYMAGVGKAVV
jgi:simple sugar transport system ATP-binding protein